MEESSAPRTYPANATEYRQWWSEQRPDVPYGFCWCECGQKTTFTTKTNKKNFLFENEPCRYIRGHEKFWRPSKNDYAVEDRGYETPCWIWQRYIHPDTGYGCVRKNSQRALLRAHRVYFELYVGPIPAGKQLDHLCRVEPCVRPSHLEPVDGCVNVQRGNSTKLNPEKVLAIRAAVDERGVDLAAKYGVLPSTICQIRQRRSWRNI